MCGIAVSWTHKVGLGEQFCGRMREYLAHRGPDSSAIWSTQVGAGELTFAHRRLSIIDLAETGSQPMHDSVSGNMLAYNGEIYNFRALRRELEHKGIVFRGTSDTEVILMGFRVWGTKIFSRLQGMFALALYWSAQNKLILARDSVGIKPLYWGANCQGVFAASELQALLRSGAVAPSLNTSAVESLLAFGSVPEPMSMVVGAEMFPPGCFVELNLAKAPSLAAAQKFYQPIACSTSAERPVVIEMLGELLRDSATTHLESDAPLGVFLSGGVDSTCLAILASQSKSTPITTLNVAFPGMGDLDESAIASETARRIGSHHISLELSAGDVENCINAWVQHIDQPSLDGLNTYLVSKAAKDAGLKVVWSGLGGDELFAGYESFRELPRFHARTKWLSWLPKFVRRNSARMFAARLSAYQRFKAIEMAGDVGDFVGLALRRRRVFADCEIAGSGLQFKDDLSGWKLPNDFALPPASQSSDWVAALSTIETSVYMRNTLLRDADVCGMAHSIEIRVPMLHRPLMEYVMSLPGSLRQKRGLVAKTLLVDAMNDARVREVATHKKRGFGLPYQQWLQGPFREKLAHGISKLKKSSLLDPKWVDRYWCDGRGNQEAPWNRPWLLGILGLWMERHLGI